MYLLIVELCLGHRLIRLIYSVTDSLIWSVLQEAIAEQLTLKDCEKDAEEAEANSRLIHKCLQACSADAASAKPFSLLHDLHVQPEEHTENSEGKDSPAVDMSQVRFN